MASHPLQSSSIKRTQLFFWSAMVLVSPISSFNVSRINRRHVTIEAFRRYGPPPPSVGGTDDDDDDDDDVASPQRNLKDKELFLQQEKEFRTLLEKVMSVQEPEHVPSLLTKNVDLILSLSGENGVQIVENILQETTESQGEQSTHDVSEAIDLILSFAENFVEETFVLEDQNKRLLGKIIRILSDKDKTAWNREEALDELLLHEKENFTAGFFRHLESECNRIATAPKMTPESVRLLQILRLVQTRVLEEIGSDLGEAAQVLGQLIGYESDFERLAVLEAGLEVRGPVFAKDMLDLTEEALQGFQRVVGGADPGLVQCMEKIHDRINRYVALQH